MAKQYYLKTGNIVCGPFTQARILIMLKDGNLQSTDQLSVDKVHWAGLKSVLTMLQPSIIDQFCSKPKSSTAGRSATNGGKPDLPLHENIAFISQQIEQKTATVNLPVSNECSAQLDRRFGRILSDTIASLGNGSCFLQRILKKGEAALTTSYVTALFLSIFITLTGCLIFQSHCLNDKLWLYLLSLIWIVSCGVIFFTTNIVLMLAGNPADYRIPGISILTSSHVMMNLAVLVTFSHGLIFTVLPHWQLQYTIILACGITGFFWFNAFTTLRISLLAAGNYSAGWASFWSFLEIWLSALLYVFVILPIYY